MIITCPSCATRYKVPEAALGAEGRVVRCKSCAHEWHAAADEPVEDGQNTTGDAEQDLAEDRNAAPPRGGDIETAALRGKLRRRQKGPSTGGRAGWAALAAAASLAAVLALGYTFRHTVVDSIPASAGVYKLAGVDINPFGLDFTNVRVSRIFENGLPVLSVSGEVVNISGTHVGVPRVRLGLRDGRRQEIYHWTVPVTEEPLPPAGRARFATKLAAPPAEARDVMVRFNGGSVARRRQASLVGG